MPKKNTFNECNSNICICLVFYNKKLINPKSYRNLYYANCYGDNEGGGGCNGRWGKNRNEDLMGK